MKLRARPAPTNFASGAVPNSIRRFYSPGTDLDRLSGPVAFGASAPRVILEDYTCRVTNHGAPLLLTGATGFVGRHLYPSLVDAGLVVRCGTRDLERARRRYPDRDWVRCDVGDPASVRSALAGCRAAYYLVHEISGAPDYPEREAESARRFADASAKAGVERVVYLGGVAPEGKPSRHLASRIETGRILRAGGTPTVELRAAMIIGAGSASWVIVRDLAARLPAMVLPRWLLYRSCPVSVDDVVVALAASAGLDVEPGVYDVPGPECLTHRELILRVATQLGKRPALVNVPVLTPQLSSYWIALVTRANLDLARELVSGLQSDLLPNPQRVFWDRVPRELEPLDIACEKALCDPTDPLSSRVANRRVASARRSKTS